MLDNFFKFKENGTDFKTEIIAGITTFLAMAYILGVNPTMLADGGMPVTGVFFCNGNCIWYRLHNHGAGCQVSARTGSRHGT
ncbi:hypothetical protein [Methanobrevibacter sp.]|uniref:hypothetical protein n=1 Tax=Methanobrevibacter sp. TaxID=66852 RepID=UPI00388FAA1A